MCVAQGVSSGGSNMTESSPVFRRQRRRNTGEEGNIRIVHRPRVDALGYTYSAPLGLKTLFRVHVNRDTRFRHHQDSEYI